MANGCQKEYFKSIKQSSDTSSFSDCPHPQWIGDSLCDDKTNTPDCDYDGGDCCGYNVNTDFCSDCKCYVNETCISGTHPLVGDGFCNDETNYENCNYDGGDCCVHINSDHCVECKCYHKENCVLGYTPSVVGDGFCNDNTNNANCNYDGGDCCGTCTLRSKCMECACLSGADDDTCQSKPNSLQFSRFQ